MSAEYEKILKEIQLDLAIIKVKLDELREIKKDADEMEKRMYGAEKDVSHLQSQMKSMRWLGAPFLLGTISYIVSKIFNLF